MYCVPDLINLRFGKLKVLERGPSVNPRTNKKSKKALWKCQCDCGQITLVNTYSLRSNHTKSCGCARVDVCRLGLSNKKEKGLSGFNTLLRSYKKGAQKRNLPFSLSLKSFKEITQKPCYYCNSYPSQKSYVAGARTMEAAEHSVYVYNGIDRIDSNIGYTDSNIVPCCSLCNYMKNDVEMKIFLEQIKKIYECQSLG